MTKEKMESLIDAARLLVADTLPPEVLPGACLYHAVAVNHFLGAPILAGSYSWKFTNKDDGTNPTHFSCIFDQVAQWSAEEILMEPGRIRTLECFPEMHVFNVLDGKVLDISTKLIRQFAYQAGGFEYEEQLKPPPYLWDVPVDKKEGRWVYAPHPLAIKLARAASVPALEILFKRRVG